MKNVTFEVLKDIYWDNWGQLVRVFRQGDICEGELNTETNTLSAESPIYEGIEDFVDLNSVKLIN